MNIGIIVHSQTGNTHSMALELEKKLSADGHAVSLERLVPIGEVNPGTKDIKLESRPDVGQYDALVFAAPVQAFSLSAVMTNYLDGLASLQGKKIACFVTKQLPFNWTGGNQAIGQMKKICQSKGAEVCGTEIVIWSNAQRDQKIANAIDTLSSLF
jgi:flavodoxin